MTARVGSLRTVVASQPLPTGPVVVLALTITDPLPPLGPCTGPDTVSPGVEQPEGTLTELAALDSRYPSTEAVGGLTGRVTGIHIAEGTVHFDWFEYEPLAP